VSVVRNEDLWDAIERLPPFSPDESHRSDRMKLYEQSWAWLELLQEGKGLTGLQIIRLQGLLAAVYEAGKADGAQK
jgi:hypothetical protein